MKKQIARAGRIGLLLLFGLFLESIGLAGCSNQSVSFDMGNHYTQETYENAKAFSAGDFSCNADQVKAVEIYWRAGQVEIVETDSKAVEISESGKDLAEDQKLHSCLQDGILKVHFFASGISGSVSSKEKQLTVRIPAGIDVAVHSTSADIMAEHLEQNSLLLTTMSGKIRLDGFTGYEGNLSSSSGDIYVGKVETTYLTVGNSTGQIQCGEVASQVMKADSANGDIFVGKLNSQDTELSTTSGDVTLSLLKDGAKLAYTTENGKLITDLLYERLGDLWVFGKGTASLAVQSVDGDLEIKEAGMD